MSENKGALPEGNPKGPKSVSANRASDRTHNKDTEPTFDIQTVRRLCRDAYLMLSLFPAKRRYSYYVDSKGRLRCRADRRPVS